MSSRPFITKLAFGLQANGTGLGTHNHFGLGVDRIFQLLEINLPLRCGRGFGRPILWWVKRHISDLTAGHFDVADIPIFTC